MNTTFVDGIEYEVGSQIVRLTPDERERLQEARFLADKAEKRERLIQNCLMLFFIPFMVGGMAVGAAQPSWKWVFLAAAATPIVALLACMPFLFFSSARLRKAANAVEYEILEQHGVPDGANYTVV